MKNVSYGDFFMWKESLMCEEYLIYEECFINGKCLGNDSCMNNILYVVSCMKIFFTGGKCFICGDIHEDYFIGGECFMYGE